MINADVLGRSYALYDGLRHGPHSRSQCFETLLVRGVTCARRILMRLRGVASVDALASSR